MATFEIVNTPYVHLFHKGEGLLRLVRNEVEFPSLAELRSTYEEMATETSRQDRSRMSLLLDFRVAPVRYDLEFDEAFEQVRKPLQDGFYRIAWLVSSPTGKLQAQRYCREDGFGAQAFLNMKLAVAFLRPKGVRPVDW